MLMLLFLFLSGLGVALLVTPCIRRMAVRFDWVDAPSGRKVHSHAMPRLGGVGIYLGVFLPLIFFHSIPLSGVGAFFQEAIVRWLMVGSTIAFLLGFSDDLKRINPLTKLSVQTFAAMVAFYGGIRLVQIELPWGSIYHLGVLSLPATIFWFLLVINAINLIDGLDGLAAGVSLFAALTLLVSSIIGGQLFISFFLAALVGACLGFLRYNFNPASIFMGDGGSYFLGYMLAALSIMGVMKSQTTVSILIPVLALGVPLMDTLLAPARRFLLGKRLFQPDKSHIHHRLLKRGLSHRNAVLAMYGATVMMGLLALFDVYASNQYAGGVLFLFGVLLLFGVRKLGYLEYLGMDKVLGYLRDVSDEIGLNRGRRTFLCCQKSIRESATADDMWKCVIDALNLIDVDYAEIRLGGAGGKADDRSAVDRSKPGGIDKGGRALRPGNMSLVLPLVNHRCHGTLYIEKDVARAPICDTTLRRIEQLRRSIVNRLSHFRNEGVRLRAEHMYYHPKNSLKKSSSNPRTVSAGDSAWLEKELLKPAKSQIASVEIHSHS